MLVDYLKADHPYLKNLLSTRTLWIFVPISMILILVLNGCFFQRNYCKSTCDGIGGAVK